MHNYVELQQIARIRQHELARDAESQRLAATIPSHHNAMPVMARVGQSLSDIGQALIERYSEEENTPAVRNRRINATG